MLHGHAWFNMKIKRSLKLGKNKFFFHLQLVWALSLNGKYLYCKVATSEGWLVYLSMLRTFCKAQQLWNSSMKFNMFKLKPSKRMSSISMQEIGPDDPSSRTSLWTVHFINMAQQTHCNIFSYWTKKIHILFNEN